MKRRIPDASPGVPSERTLGTQRNQAASGADPRLSDARLTVDVDGVEVGRRRRLDIVAASGNITLVGTDLPDADTVQVSIDGSGGGGGGAPTGAHYVVTELNGTLSNEQLLTDSTSITWNTATPGSVSADAVLGNTAGTVCAGDDARLSNDRTADSLRTASGVVLVGAASDPSAGQVLTADGTGNADWQDPAAGGSDDIVYADPKMAAVTMSTTYEVLGEKTITVAAGDLIEVHCSGTLENNSGATKTFEWQLEIIANGNTETLVLRDGTTVASSAVNKAPWLWRSSSTITASQCHTVALSTRAAPAASTALGAGTSGSTIRMHWAQDANDYTGSCTLRLSGRVTAATTLTYLNVQSFWIQQTPTRP